MNRTRKFDHDEARRRVAAGERISVVARELGVTSHAVYRVVSPATAEADRQATRAYYDRNRVPCERCGQSTLSALTISGKRNHNPDGRSLCRKCRGIEMRERLIFDTHGVLIAVRCVMLDCANGERWQFPENFTRGSRHHDAREGGIHSQCRACQTRMRRRHRAQHPEESRAYDRQYKAKRRRARARAG